MEFMSQYDMIVNLININTMTFITVWSAFENQTKILQNMLDKESTMTVTMSMKLKM